MSLPDAHHLHFTVVAEKIAVAVFAQGQSRVGAFLDSEMHFLQVLFILLM